MRIAPIRNCKLGSFKSTISDMTNQIVALHNCFETTPKIQFLVHKETIPSSL